MTLRGPAATAAAVLLAVCTTALVELAGPASAAGAEPGDVVVVDVPDDPQQPDATAFSRLRPAQVERLARLDPAVRTALLRRPDARVDVRYLQPQRRWKVRVRDSGSRSLLALVELDDRTGQVVSSWQRPLGDYPSRLTKREAIDAAVADERVRRLARRWGGIDRLRASASLDGCCWEVDLFDPERAPPRADDPVLRVDVLDATGNVTGVWTGVQIAWKMARGKRDAFGGSVNERWIWLPFLALFALVAIDWARLRTLFTVDVLMLLALAVSHEAFLRGEIDWSVPLALPPLVWLGARMAWLFARGLPEQAPAARPRGRLGRLALRPVPTVAILLACVALAGVRIGITLEGGNVIDVGYAGVAGARLELEGQAPWGAMPEDNPRGDTYGPANYLAYVPAVLLLDDPERHDWGQELPAAQATSIAADLGCALLLGLIGWRWISRRGAALLMAGWLACPWTLWALASGVNDALVALPLLAAFALARRPLARGLLVGVAAAVKFAPLVALAPLLHLGSRRRLRQATFTAAGCAAALLAAAAWVTWRLEGSAGEDLRLFLERTVLFQSGRGSPFSVWGLYELPTAQLLARIAVAVALVAACVLPRARDAWQVAAGIAAALIGVQLVLTHWFYLYLPWFVGFLLIVLVAARERPDPAGDADAGSARGGMLAA